MAIGTTRSIRRAGLVRTESVARTDSAMASLLPESESAGGRPPGAVARLGRHQVTRRAADRPVRWVAPFATVVAVAVTTAIVVLSLALLAVRFVGLNAYVVQGGPTESVVPIGSLVVTAPVLSDAVGASDEAGGESWQAPKIGTAWVAIPTLGYAVTYAEAYSSPIVMGLVVWILFVFALRALEPHTSTARRRLPA